MIELDRERDYRAEISMAPLVDCILLLLIFFLLTSTFADQNSFELQLPTAKSASSSEKQSVELACTAAGNLYLDEKPVAESELTERLKKLLAGEKKRGVLLISDRQVELARVTGLIDKIKQAGGSSVSIATREKTNG